MLNQNIQDSSGLILLLPVKSYESQRKFAQFLMWRETQTKISSNLNENYPQSQHIKEPYRRAFKLIHTKYVILQFLPEKKITDVSLVVFFPRKIVSNQYILKDREMTHLIVNLKF